MYSSADILGKKILVVTAHPDDESFLAAGTISANAKAGGQTVLVCATAGEKGISHLEKLLNDSELKNIRQRELKDAAEILGINQVIQLHFPDGKVNQHESDFLAKVFEVLDSTESELLLGFGSDGITAHQDHIAASSVAAKAAAGRRIPLATFCLPHEVLTEAIAMLKMRRYTYKHYELEPAAPGQENVRINIDPQIKLQALKCYQSQIDQDDPFNNFPIHVKELLLRKECFCLHS